MSHLGNHNILVDYQHGFRKGRSCETQLINAIEDLSRSLNNRNQTGMLILDFSKAFDTVACVARAKGRGGGGGPVEKNGRGGLGRRERIIFHGSMRLG